MALLSLGVGLAWNQGLGGSDAARWHAGCGWVLFVAAWAQVVGAWMRGSKGGPTEPQMRGDHYDMTPWRLMFERLHKSLGWLLLLASAAVIVLGLAVVDAPRWMPLVLCIWWLALTASFVILQKRGRCIDTYQAIWGPDAQHPGNQIAPIGWGVKRALEK